MGIRVDLTPTGRDEDKRVIEQKERRRWVKQTKKGVCTGRNSKPRR
jgi:hypothetical protein